MEEERLRNQAEDEKQDRGAVEQSGPGPGHRPQPDSINFFP